jgi:hypothetical protein
VSDTRVVAIANDGCDELLEAIWSTPLSAELKERLWDELFDLPHFHGGPEGISYWAGETASSVKARKLTIRPELGRAGITLAAAFRALAAIPLHKVSDH